LTNEEASKLKKKRFSKRFEVLLNNNGMDDNGQQLYKELSL
jgi:hypothetical protein